VCLLGADFQELTGHAAYVSALLLFLNLRKNNNLFEITTIENRKQLQQTLKI
jgi:hypothetical protein